MPSGQPEPVWRQRQSIGLAQFHERLREQARFSEGGAFSRSSSPRLTLVSTTSFTRSNRRFMNICSASGKVGAVETHWPSTAASSSEIPPPMPMWALVACAASPMISAPPSTAPGQVGRWGGGARTRPVESRSETAVESGPNGVPIAWTSS